MKTKILGVLAVALFLGSTGLKAQRFTGGITAGLTRGSVEVSEINNAFTNSIKGKDIYGFETGIFGRLNFNPLYLKGMLLAAYQGGPSDFRDNDGTIKTSRFSVGKIEVPVLLGLHIIGPLRIEGGPVYNWIYYEDHSFDNSINVQRSGLGYRVGANIEFGIVNIGAAYQGLYNNSASSSTATFKTPDELIFSLGILLGGRSK